MSIPEIGAIIAIVITVGGAVFAIMNYFKKPQDNLEVRQAVSEGDIKSKYHILEEQLKWEKETNEKRFVALDESLKSIIALNQNHTHTIDVKVDALREQVSSLRTEMTGNLCELKTIINERIPKKH